jgi:hypothetical protein
MTRKILILSTALLFSSIVVFVFSGFHSIIAISKGEIQCSADQNGWLMDGDIVFQTTNSAQCEAVQLATNSPYSHCGIVFRKNGSWHVLEAVQPVRYRSFDLWIQQGMNGHYVVKRLKNAESLITPDVAKKMQKEGAKMLGKDYDITFEWSDKEIYCSELVWKIYKRVLDIEVGSLKKLGDFDLTSDIVKRILKERYGANIPLNETVISPADIFESELLIEIKPR